MSLQCAQREQDAREGKKRKKDARGNKTATLVLYFTTPMRGKGGGERERGKEKKGEKGGGKTESHGGKKKVSGTSPSPAIS